MSFDSRLQGLTVPAARASLSAISRGIEKESLRVDAAGGLAQTPHPRALGSAFKHAYITTDFSEALLEFITPVCASIDDALNWLTQIHQVASRALIAQQEVLWVASMPCILQGNDAIPLAQYGVSNAATMKTVYRAGLGNRYGRLMQTISGIHYNVSFPDALWQALQAADGNQDRLSDYKTAGYFALIRNFRRHLWLLLYLFGASPAVCKTFVAGREHSLVPLHEKSGTLHLPYATSLRMGGLGYQSDAQNRLTVSYNSLSEYAASVKQGLTETYPAYEAIGTEDSKGEWQQLSTALLQIENELYATIRPKRVADKGETPIVALAERGVEYIEVRCLDVNPYQPLGLDGETAHFVEAFLLWCLLTDSPNEDAAERERILQLQQLTVERGRDPELRLPSPTGPRAIGEWGLEVLAGVSACAELLDQANGSASYQVSVAAQTEKLQDASKTPSAQLLADLLAREQGFFSFACAQSEQFTRDFAEAALDAEVEAAFVAEAQRSIAAQAEVEANDSGSFAEFLADYYRHYQRL